MCWIFSIKLSIPSGNALRRRANPRQDELSRLVQEIRATPQTQPLIFSMLTPKADIGFMLLTPDLHTANVFEKKLTLSLGTDVLSPSYSYLSMTEWTQYVSSEEEHAAKITAEKGFQPGSPEHAAEMETFHKHMAESPGPAPSQHAGLAGLLFLPHEQTPQRRQQLVRPAVHGTPETHGRPCRHWDANTADGCGN